MAYPLGVVRRCHDTHSGEHLTTRLARIGRDQVESYAARKGVDRAEVERWLAPNLGYEPGS